MQSTDEANLISHMTSMSCIGVNKVFPIYDEGASWRVIFGRKSNSKSINALSDISLEVPKGKFVGILGHNGAGKSTLLRTLGGVYSPTSGQIKSEGYISSLFELGGFGNRYLTGREYATRLLRFHGVKKSELTDLVEGIHDFSELNQSFDQRIQSYSSGMAARLYFATATAIQHDIYLVDEILSVGDEHFQTKCWQRLRERFAQGSSGVLVTHDWAAILKLCEQAHIMNRGQIIYSDRSDKVVQKYLNLPKPEKKAISFTENVLDHYTVQSNQDSQIVVEVELKEDIPVDLSYSIEMLRVGIGWEIILLQDCGLVADKVGRYRVCITIPKLPLVSGRYYLNLFLNGLRAENGSRESYDVRSWTVGNGIDLIVEGPRHDFDLIFPVTWNQKS